MHTHEPLADAVTGFPSESDTRLQDADRLVVNDPQPLPVLESAILITAADTIGAIDSFAPETRHADLMVSNRALPLTAAATELEIRVKGASTVAVDVANDVGVVPLPAPAAVQLAGRSLRALAGLAAAIVLAVLGSFAWPPVPVKTLPTEPTPAETRPAETLPLAAITPVPTAEVTVTAPPSDLTARPFVATIVALAGTAVADAARPFVPLAPASVAPSVATLPPARPEDDSIRLAERQAALEAARRALAPPPRVNTVTLEPEAPIIPTILPPPISPAPAAAGPAPAAGASSPPPAAAVPSAAAGTAATDAITALLDGYRGAFNRLDAEAARVVWPSADVRSLGRAFSGLVEQQLSFDNCAITLRGESATAECRGTATYVPKVGRRSPRVEPRQWHFEVQRRDAAWLIQSVAAR